MVMISIDFSSCRRRARSMLSGVRPAVLGCAAMLAVSPADAGVAVEAGLIASRQAELATSRLPSGPFAHFLGADAAQLPERFAQSSVGRFQLDRRSREISDQEHAKDRRDRGQNKSFDELFQRARTVGRGEYLGVEPDISSNIYRFKFMRTSGKVVWVDMDGQTGRVVAERE